MYLPVLSEESHERFDLRHIDNDNELRSALNELNILDYDQDLNYKNIMQVCTNFMASQYDAVARSAGKRAENKVIALYQAIQSYCESRVEA